jgi:hypothetical protein
MLTTRALRTDGAPFHFVVGAGEGTDIHGL